MAAGPRGAVVPGAWKVSFGLSCCLRAALLTQVCTTCPVGGDRLTFVEDPPRAARATCALSSRRPCGICWLRRVGARSGQGWDSHPGSLALQPGAFPPSQAAGQRPRGDGWGRCCAPPATVCCCKDGLSHCWGEVGPQEAVRTGWQGGRGSPPASPPPLSWPDVS